jgi:hypothetical protein
MSMPTRKQRQRKLKGKRHQYETVWLDEDGNELDGPPPEAVEERPQRPNGARATPAKAKKPAARDAKGRPVRVPPQPSWNRAVKRAALLGAVVFVLFSMTASKADNRYVAALVPAVIYTAMFIPFTYWIDRFAYRRYQMKYGDPAGATPRPAKKR